MAALPAKARRKALEVLSRDTLATITENLNIDVEDRRTQAAHVDAIIRSRAVDFGQVLRQLSRDELKAICEALDLDTSGREKESIVERILGAEAGGEVAVPMAKDREEPAGAFELTAPESKVRKAGATATLRSAPGEPTADYRHDAKRKNNPPAGLIDLEKPPPQPTRKYAYDPHLDPQLQWSGKAEHTSFEVDTVSLHIHERISTQAIMRAVQREEAQRSLFGGDDLPESKAIDFYAHDVGWANRLILGDSLLVMNSLLEREQMAGKVQCIYVDPPYGVKFNSNFQPSISRRDVKDGDDGSLTREPEQIQAYRDTWTLGIHSYLTYLRDRLLLARELLDECGSLFIQISDDNVHHVREVVEEVFGEDNFCTVIPFVKMGVQTSALLPVNYDFLLWTAKDRTRVKYRQLYLPKGFGEAGGEQYSHVRLPSGETRRLRSDEASIGDLPRGGRVLRPSPLISAGFRQNTTVPYEFDGKTYHPGLEHNWKSTVEGLDRLRDAQRLRGSFRRCVKAEGDVTFRSPRTKAGLAPGRKESRREEGYVGGRRGVHRDLGDVGVVRKGEGAGIRSGPPRGGGHDAAGAREVGAA